MKLRNHAYNEAHVDKLQEVLAPTLHMLWALCVARKNNLQLKFNCTAMHVFVIAFKVVWCDLSQ